MHDDKKHATVHLEAVEELVNTGRFRVSLHTIVLASKSMILHRHIPRRELEPGKKTDDEQEGEPGEILEPIPMGFTIELIPPDDQPTKGTSRADLLLDNMLNSYEIARKELIRSSLSLHFGTLLTLLVLLFGSIIVILGKDPATQITTGVISALMTALSLYIRTTLLTSKHRAEIQVEKHDKRVIALLGKINDDPKDKSA